MDLCDKNQVWSNGWRQLRARSDDDFREAVEEAATLHATDELFAKHIEPELAPKDRVEWAMAEESDADEEGTPPHADADEPDQIDVPPALPMSNLERCFARRLICGAGPR